MSTHLLNLLQNATAKQPASTLEPIVQTLVADNLESACSFVEKAATEKAVVDTEAALADAVTLALHYLPTAYHLLFSMRSARSTATVLELVNIHFLI